MREEWRIARTLNMRAALYIYLSLISFIAEDIHTGLGKELGMRIHHIEVQSGRGEQQSSVGCGRGTD